MHAHPHLHGPGHHHHHPVGDKLAVALALTAVILVVEVVAAVASGSLALLSDAGHIVTDVFALGLAWFATRFSGLPPDERNTFGYRRGGILAALVNAALLVAIAAAILFAAALRFAHAPHVDGPLVIAAAAVALTVNAFIVLQLRGEGHGNLNVRAAQLHVLGDIAASVGVVVAGVAITLWHLYWLDPVLSAAVAVLIALGAWNVLRDTALILMEGTPADIDLDAVQRAMWEVPGVTEVHDLHVWALSDGFRLLSAHVVVPEQSLSDVALLLADLKLTLQRRFQIEHATIETECADCRVPLRRPLRLHNRDEPA